MNFFTFAAIANTVATMPRAFRILSLLVMLFLVGCSNPIPREPLVTEPLSDPNCQTDPVPRRLLTASEATLSDVLSSALPGDEITLSGTFGAIANIPSGTPGAPLVIRGPAKIEGLLDLGNASDVVVRGLSFVSDNSHSWMSGSGDRVRIVGNAFDVRCFNCGDEFAGMRLSGAEWELCGNRFGSWSGDMILIRGAEGTIVQENDFSQSAAGHAVLSYLGQELVVRNNFFRNPWDRVLHIASLEPEILTANALIEGNVFFDSDWDRRRDRPDADEDTRGDGGGALEVVRLIGANHIFRGNLVLSTQIGNDRPCHGGVVVSTFDDPPHWANRTNVGLRAYHNTFVDNAQVAFAVNDYNQDTSTIRDNRLEHNIFAKSQVAAWQICSNRRDDDVLTPRDNLYDEDEVVAPAQTSPGSPTDIGVDELAQIGPVRFADVGLLERAAADPEGLSLDARALFFEAFQLQEPRPPLPLTSVVEASAGPRIVVADATYFAGARGALPGESIEVAGTLARIVAVDGNALELDVSVTTTIGADVFWAPARTSVGAPRE